MLGGKQVFPLNKKEFEAASAALEVQGHAGREVFWVEREEGGRGTLWTGRKDKEAGRGFGMDPFLRFLSLSLEPL